MATEVLIDGLMEAGLIEVWAAAAVVIGSALFRRMSRHPAIAREPAAVRVSGDGVIAVRPI